ncbi:MAG: hypothetical protein LBU40_00460, partial [Methanobrevibacter sp.]|nr:hypothetical protein [Methanobrevibacter sp.]
MGSNKISEVFYPSIAENYEPFKEENVDDLNSSEIFHVVDADSSQIAVLEEAKKGQNLVVEGPPGTGKSQTIVNLIAELMANEKTVLFVSEKMAALEVVKNRLDNIGLGEGCLELHSNKSNKKDVLNNLKETLYKERFALKEVSETFSDLERSKNTLNLYMESITKIFGLTGYNAYDFIGILESNTQEIEKYSKNPPLFIEMKDMSLLNQSKRGELIDAINQIKESYSKVEPVLKNPWKVTTFEKLSRNDMEKIKEEYLKNILKKIDNLSKVINEINRITQCIKLKTFDKLNEYCDNVNILKENPKVIHDENIKHLLDSIEKYQIKRKDISDVNILNKDLKKIRNDLGILKNNTNDLNIKYDVFVKKDLIEIVTNINRFSEYLSDLVKLRKNIVNYTGVKILDNLNVEEYCDNINILKKNPKVIRHSNIEELIEKIKLYQDKVDDLYNKTLLDEDLVEIKTNANELYQTIQSSNIDSIILDKENLKEILKNIKDIDGKIDNSEIKNCLDDENLENKLNLFKQNMNSFSKFINSDFRSIKKEFKSYYSAGKISNEQVDKDFSEIVNWNNALKELNKKISNYSKDEKVDFNLILTAKNLIDSSDKLNAIKSKVFTSNQWKYKSFVDLENELDNLIFTKNKLEYINSNDSIGKHYFGDCWQGSMSNVDNLRNYFENTLKKFNNLFDSGFFSDSTPIKLEKGLNGDKINELINLLEEKIHGIVHVYTVLDGLLNFGNQKSDENEYNSEFDIYNAKIENLADISEKLVIWVEKLKKIQDTISNSIFEPINNFEELENTLQHLLETKKILNFIELNNNTGKSYFGDFWQGSNSDLTILKDKYTICLNYTNLYKQKFFSDLTNKLLKKGMDLKLINEHLAYLKTARNEIINDYNLLNDLLSFSNEYNIKFINSTDFNELKYFFKELNDNGHKLPNWRAYKQFCSKYIEEYGEYTTNFIAIINEDRLKEEIIIPTFIYNIAKNSLNDIFEDNNVLDNFDADNYSNITDMFKKLDKNIIEINKLRVKEILQDKRPDIKGSVIRTSELGVLSHEFNKKRKIKPIRRMLTECSNVIRDTKPCFMM